MAHAKQFKQIHQMTVPQWEAAFPNEDACCTHVSRRTSLAGRGCLPSVWKHEGSGAWHGAMELAL